MKGKSRHTEQCITAAILCAFLGIGTLADQCASEQYRVHDDFVAGRMGECEVVSANEFVLKIDPEDAPPINPSPWYAFRVQRLASERSVQFTITYAQDYKHRYTPKISTDGVTWREIPDSDLQSPNEDRIVISVSGSGPTFTISAQPIIEETWYRQWYQELQELWPTVQVSVVGYSVERRPIHAIQTNPGAPYFVLLLGRQHPPEVTGAIAMRRFVNQLFLARVHSCSTDASSCSFFRTHNIVIVPLLNPDGVAAGHWRHNMASVDLNRDWGEFMQPETRAVLQLVDSLVSADEKPRVMLDFHSTRSSVLYTQTDEDVTHPRDFARRWLDRASQLAPDHTLTRAPREVSDLSTSKNYFFRRFGVPSITYELADTADEEFIVESSDAMAAALIDVLMGDGESQDWIEVPPPCEDFYCHMFEVNIASLATLDRGEIVPHEQVGEIAGVLQELSRRAESDTELRTSNYLNVEERVIEIIGDAGANMHVGRSRQDLHGTVRRLLVRDQWAEVARAVVDVRQELLKLAEREAATVIPAYTHGVPSQPTTFGHMLLAFSASLERDFDRLKEVFARINQSPLGAAAGTTSGYAIDRSRLSVLLGFHGPVDNSYDANFVSSIGARLEFASVLAQSAIPIGHFVQNVHAQQRQPLPWIRLAESATSKSSIMPQKRNPRPLDRLRTQASDVIGRAHSYFISSHNVDSGMHDYRRIDLLLELTESAVRMYERYRFVLSVLRVDADLALADVLRSYATSTEVADLLFREYSVPFRTGHTFASELTNIVRSTNRPFSDLTDEEIKAAMAKILRPNLAISIEEIRGALDPASFVAQRKGSGGPQASEMHRAIRAHQRSLAEQTLWLDQTVAGLRENRRQLYVELDRMLN